MYATDSDDSLQKPEGRPRLVPVRSFQYFHEIAAAPPPAPSAVRAIVDYRGRRERRIELKGSTFGSIRVVRFAGVRNGKAFWEVVCDKHLGGCGRAVKLPGSRVRSRKHCGCQRARRLEHGGVRLSLAGWATRLGISIDSLEWRLQHWPTALALTLPPQRRSSP